VAKHRTDLTKGVPLPSTWVNALMEYVSTMSANLVLSKASNTTVQIVAGTVDDQVSVGIDGRWRYNTTTVTATHPGGTSGTYDVFVTAADNDFSAADPADNTNYAFGLQVLAQGSTPATALSRKVGTVDWDGTQITRVAQTVGGVGGGSSASAGAYTAVIGNGVSTTIDVIHGMSSSDVVPVVRETNPPNRIVEPEVRVLDANTVRLIFDVAPAANALTVSVLAGASTIARGVGVYSVSFGDGASTSYPITHNLNTRDLVVTVRENVAPYREVDAEVQMTTVNQVTVVLASAPAANALTIILAAGVGSTGAASNHALQHTAAGSDRISAYTPGASLAAPIQVRDVGQAGQIRAGRVLTAADFTAIGLSAPAGLWNLSDLTDASGNARALANKGAVPFTRGISGAATEAAQFAGSTAQALYVADSGAADSFRIRNGSWGAWFRTAKRGSGQFIICKDTTGASNRGWYLWVDGQNHVEAGASSGAGTTVGVATGDTDVADDRWHFAVAVYDGIMLWLYLDGVLEKVSTWSPGIATPGMFPSTAPLNVGGRAADGATAAGNPFFGRVDEAFVTTDALSADQVRSLYAAKIAHGYATTTPDEARVSVRRRRRGGALATTDFPAAPRRLYNMASATPLADEGLDAAALAAPNSVTAVSGADGSALNALYLNGSNQRLEVTDTGLPSGLGARSYGAWFKTTNSGTIISWGATSGTNDARLDVYSGGLRSLSGGAVITGPPVADGAWHFAVAVDDNSAIDGIKRKLYLDGRLVANDSTLNSITLGGAAKFRIGADAVPGQYYAGAVDGVFVCDYALTPEQIAALYAVGSQSLGVSPKNPGDHIERIDATSVYAIFDSLEPQHQVDLKVAA
jgi:hypothetical protein